MVSAARDGNGRQLAAVAVVVVVLVLGVALFLTWLDSGSSQSIEPSDRLPEVEQILQGVEADVSTMPLPDGLILAGSSVETFTLDSGIVSEPSMIVSWDTEGSVTAGARQMAEVLRANGWTVEFESDHVATVGTRSNGSQLAGDLYASVLGDLSLTANVTGDPVCTSS